MTTKVVKGIHIRGFYAVAILSGFVNRFFALPEKLKQMEKIDWPDPVVNFLNDVGTWAFFVVISVFAIWVLTKFIANLKFLRGEV